MSDNAPVLAVIGGTGLYQFPALANARRIAVDTPYGAPSGEVVLGEVEGRTVAFLARHGESHTIAPHRVNYRANVWALHHLGARQVVGVNAVGGITDAFGPKVLALPHQLIDYTHGRFASFCDVDGAKVQHIDFSVPYTTELREALANAADALGIQVVWDGVYGATQGPRLETVAEIARMRRDGCDLVGMTGMPEAALARELELDYACLAVVANWAAGCGDTEAISLDEIYANLAEATGGALRILTQVIANLP
jgi:5'-methylthioinosine phosphorylase